MSDPHLDPDHESNPLADVLCIAVMLGLFVYVVFGVLRLLGKA